MGGGQKSFCTCWGGVKKVLAACKGGSKKFDDENFQLPSPPHQSIYEHSLNEQMILKNYKVSILAHFKI